MLPTMQCQVGLCLVSNSFFILVAISLSVLNCLNAATAQLMASCLKSRYLYFIYFIHTLWHIETSHYYLVISHSFFNFNFNLLYIFNSYLQYLCIYDT